MKLEEGMELVVKSERMKELMSPYSDMKVITVKKFDAFGIEIEEDGGRADYYYSEIDEVATDFYNRNSWGNKSLLEKIKFLKNDCKNTIDINTAISCMEEKEKNEILASILIYND